MATRACGCASQNLSHELKRDFSCLAWLAAPLNSGVGPRALLPDWAPCSCVLMGVEFVGKAYYGCWDANRTNGRENDAWLRMMSPMTLQVGGHHAHHGAHPYREAYLRERRRAGTWTQRRAHRRPAGSGGRGRAQWAVRQAGSLPRRAPAAGQSTGQSRPGAAPAAGTGGAGPAAACDALDGRPSPAGGRVGVEQAPHVRTLLSPALMQCSPAPALLRPHCRRSCSCAASTTQRWMPAPPWTPCRGAWARGSAPTCWRCAACWRAGCCSTACRWGTWWTMASISECEGACGGPQHPAWCHKGGTHAAPCFTAEYKPACLPLSLARQPHPTLTPFPRRSLSPAVTSAPASAWRYRTAPPTCPPSAPSTPSPTPPSPSPPWPTTSAACPARSCWMACSSCWDWARMHSRRTLQSGWRWRPRTSPQAGPSRAQWAGEPMPLAAGHGRLLCPPLHICPRPPCCALLQRIWRPWTRPASWTPPTPRRWTCCTGCSATTWRQSTSGSSEHTGMQAADVMLRVGAVRSTALGTPGLHRRWCAEGNEGALHSWQLAPPVWTSERLSPSCCLPLPVLHNRMVCVFPEETRQFPHRLVATSWNLADNPCGRVVGFSGKLEGRRGLDAPELPHDDT